MSNSGNDWEYDRPKKFYQKSTYQSAFVVGVVMILTVLAVFAGAVYMAKVMDGYESHPETRSAE